MRAAIIGLTLFAAILHATWNAVLRSGADRLWSITIMSFATTAVAVPLAFFLPLPWTTCWTYLIVSAVLQVAYSILLAYAYQYGELGLVYPIVRGSVPLLVTIGGSVLASQHLNRPALLGIALISLGIVSLAFGRARTHVRSVALALAAALFVASYVTADAVGVRLAGNPRSYVVWAFIVYGVLMPPAFLLLRRRITVDLLAPETLKAMAGGLISLGSYAAVVTALALGNAGPVSALRETSIVFSALIGRVVLGESLTARRILVCLVVALGAVCIGYGS
jgi:drug/metabolite transporter (DMT)-like permease